MPNTPAAICTVQHIDHVGVAVRDLKAAMELFHRVFGIPPGEIKTSPQDGVQGVMLSQGETRIELVSPLGENTPVARFLARRGEGLHHLAFRVDNVTERLEALKTLGIQLVDQEPRPGMSGMIAFIHPKSVHGVLTELVQPYGD